MSEWISVKDRLPDNDDMMLVTARTKKGMRSVNRAYYSESTQSWHGSGSMAGVTAWMPLPEPYQDTTSWLVHPTNDFCVHCGDLRGKKRGISLLDSRRVGDNDMDLIIELESCGRLWLAVRMDGETTCATPISYCPICGKRLEVET